MARRRTQLTPWRAAGSRSERRSDADAVVRETGWVFNNETGDQLSLQQFVETGDKEVRRFLNRFGLSGQTSDLSMLEIGSGIGRMTAAFTREFSSVIATDVDAAFLEICRTTCGRFGRNTNLRTAHIADGHTIPCPDNSVDLVFTYIVLQHCSSEDALALTREAFRVVKPGGRVILNYRTWVRQDALLVPAGIAIRSLWRVPVIGSRLSKWRWSTRLGWQANRLRPRDVISHLETAGYSMENIEIYRHPDVAQPEALHQGNPVPQQHLKSANKSHWWLSATRR
jgi:ubiquinone/menaquinone biosynthesis C-methylase UbiE